MHAAEMETLARAAVARGVWVVLDLCYERLVYEPAPRSATRVLADVARDQAVLVGSCSKAYAMTGWRCGWVAGPKQVVAACASRQSHATSNICSIAQYAAVAALTGPQQCVADMLAEYRARRDAMRAWLAPEARIRCAVPEGAFYLFLDIGDLLTPDGLRTSADFARALLEQEHVAVTPGEAFDAPGFLRLSYATSMTRLEEGARRMRAFLARLDEGRVHGDAQ
jgi:aspartate aminotransferase